MKFNVFVLLLSETSRGETKESFTHGKRTNF
jgi:hypothetical protein